MCLSCFAESCGHKDLVVVGGRRQLLGSNKEKASVLPGRTFMISSNSTSPGFVSTLEDVCVRAGRGGKAFIIILMQVLPMWEVDVTSYLFSG